MIARDLFLSIRPEWLRMILDGEKSVELRRCLPAHAEPGCRVILYETGKDGAVKAVADLVEVVHGKGPAAVFVPHLWHVFSRAGMTQADVEAYFSTGKRARRPGGLVLENVQEIDPVPRARVTGTSPTPWTGFPAGFRIPQSWRYLPRSVADSLVKGAP